MALLQSLSSKRLFIGLLILAGAGLLALTGLGLDRLMKAADGEEPHVIAALRRILPGASRFQRLTYAEGVLQPVSSPGEGGLYAAYDAGGGFIGYGLSGEGPGYQGTIRLVYGYSPSQRRIVGVEVLASQETPGWGEKIQSNPAFQENLRTLSVDPRIVIVKEGEKTRSNEVEAITGATVSCNSVVAILDNTTRRWLKRLPPPGAEPPLALDRASW